MDLFPATEQEMSLSQLTWLLSAGFVVSDSKEPGKRRDIARVKHIKFMLSKAMVTGGKAAYISFFAVCVLKPWVSRRCILEASKDRRHRPHQFASYSIIPTGYESCRDSRIMVLSYASKPQQTAM